MKRNREHAKEIATALSVEEDDVKKDDQPSPTVSEDSASIGSSGSAYDMDVIQQRNSSHYANHHHHNQQQKKKLQSLDSYIVPSHSQTPASSAVVVSETSSTPVKHNSIRCLPSFPNNSNILGRNSSHKKVNTNATPSPAVRRRLQRHVQQSNDESESSSIATTITPRSEFDRNHSWNGSIRSQESNSLPDQKNDDPFLQPGFSFDAFGLDEHQVDEEVSAAIQDIDNGLLDDDDYDENSTAEDAFEDEEVLEEFPMHSFDSGSGSRSSTPDDLDGFEDGFRIMQHEDSRQPQLSNAHTAFRDPSTPGPRAKTPDSWAEFGDPFSGALSPYVERNDPDGYTSSDVQLSDVFQDSETNSDFFSSAFKSAPLSEVGPTPNFGSPDPPMFSNDPVHDIRENQIIERKPIQNEVINKPKREFKMSPSTQIVPRATTRSPPPHTQEWAVNTHDDYPSRNYNHIPPLSQSRFLRNTPPRDSVHESHKRAEECKEQRTSFASYKERLKPPAPTKTERILEQSHSNQSSEHGAIISDHSVMDRIRANEILLAQKKAERSPPPPSSSLPSVRMNKSRFESRRQLEPTEERGEYDDPQISFQDSSEDETESQSSSQDEEQPPTTMGQVTRDSIRDLLTRETVTRGIMRETAREETRETTREPPTRETITREPMRETWRREKTKEITSEPITRGPTRERETLTGEPTTETMMRGPMRETWKRETRKETTNEPITRESETTTRETTREPKATKPMIRGPMRETITTEPMMRETSRETTIKEPTRETTDEPTTRELTGESETTTRGPMRDTWRRETTREPKATKPMIRRPMRETITRETTIKEPTRETTTRGPMRDRWRRETTRETISTEQVMRGPMRETVTREPARAPTTKEPTMRETVTRGPMRETWRRREAIKEARREPASETISREHPGETRIEQAVEETMEQTTEPTVEPMSESELLNEPEVVPVQPKKLTYRERRELELKAQEAEKAKAMGSQQKKPPERDIAALIRKRIAANKRTAAQAQKTTDRGKEDISTLRSRLKKVSIESKITQFRAPPVVEQPPPSPQPEFQVDNLKKIESPELQQSNSNTQLTPDKKEERRSPETASEYRPSQPVTEGNPVDDTASRQIRDNAPTPTGLTLKSRTLDSSPPSPHNANEQSQPDESTMDRETISASQENTKLKLNAFLANRMTDGPNLTPNSPPPPMKSNNAPKDNDAVNALLKRREQQKPSMASSIPTNSPADPPVPAAVEEAPKMSFDGRPALKEDPKYERYFRMLKVGMPLEVVKHAMIRDGIDPSILDGDHNKPAGFANGGVPLKEDPKYEKYFKMLKMGLPMGAVKNAMERNGLDSSVMDGDHNLPANMNAAKGGAMARQEKKPKDTHRRTRVHWDILRKVRENSLWAKIDGDEEIEQIEIDEEEFQELFQAELTPAEAKKSRNGQLKRGAAVRVIDSKRANNGGIILARLKMSHDEMADAVDRIDSDVLSSEQMQNIIEYLPSSEERKGLESYMLSGGTDAAEKFEGLCECEKFMVAMMTVRHAKRKVRALLFKLQFSSCLQSLEQDAGMVENACNELSNSIRLRKLLGIVLNIGNRLNTAGVSTKRKAGAFTLDSLLKLSHAKAFDKKTTFLHYLILVVQRNNEGLLGFKDDLPTVFKADKVYWDQCINDLEEVENQLENVRRISLHQACLLPRWRRKKKKKKQIPIDDDQSLSDSSMSLEEEVEALRSTEIGMFTLGAIKQVSALRDKVETTKMQFAKLLEYFGEDERQETQPHDLFSTICLFCRDFDKAKEHVQSKLKKQKKEERKSKQGKKPAPSNQQKMRQEQAPQPKLFASNMQPSMSAVMKVSRQAKPKSTHPPENAPRPLDQTVASPMERQPGPPPVEKELEEIHSKSLALNQKQKQNYRHRDRMRLSPTRSKILDSRRRMSSANAERSKNSPAPPVNENEDRQSSQLPQVMETPEKIDPRTLQGNDSPTLQQSPSSSSASTQMSLRQKARLRRQRISSRSSPSAAISPTNSSQSNPMSPAHSNSSPASKGASNGSRPLSPRSSIRAKRRKDQRRQQQ